MTIASKLLQINLAKQSIKSALISKSVDMSNVTFSAYGEVIRNLPLLSGTPRYVAVTQPFNAGDWCLITEPRVILDWGPALVGWEGTGLNVDCWGRESPTEFAGYLTEPLISSDGYRLVCVCEDNRTNPNGDMRITTYSWRPAESMFVKLHSELHSYGDGSEYLMIYRAWGSKAHLADLFTVFHNAGGDLHVRVYRDSARSGHYTHITNFGSWAVVTDIKSTDDGLRVFITGELTTGSPVIHTVQWWDKSGDTYVLGGTFPDTGFSPSLYPSLAVSANGDIVRVQGRTFFWDESLGSYVTDMVATNDQFTEALSANGSKLLCSINHHLKFFNLDSEAGAFVEGRSPIWRGSPSSTIYRCDMTPAGKFAYVVGDYQHIHTFSWDSGQRTYVEVPSPSGMGDVTTIQLSDTRIAVERYIVTEDGMMGFVCQIYTSLELMGTIPLPSPADSPFDSMDAQDAQNIRGIGFFPSEVEAGVMGIVSTIWAHTHWWPPIDYPTPDEDDG